MITLEFAFFINYKIVIFPHANFCAKMYFECFNVLLKASITHLTGKVPRAVSCYCIKDMFKQFVNSFSMLKHAVFSCKSFVTVFAAKHLLVLLMNLYISFKGWLVMGHFVTLITFFTILTNVGLSYSFWLVLMNNFNMSFLWKLYNEQLKTEWTGASQFVMFLFFISSVCENELLANKPSPMNSDMTSRIKGLQKNEQ